MPEQQRTWIDGQSTAQLARLVLRESERNMTVAGLKEPMPVKVLEPQVVDRVAQGYIDCLDENVQLRRILRFVQGKLNGIDHYLSSELGKETKDG